MMALQSCVVCLPALLELSRDETTCHELFEELQEQQQQQDHPSSDTSCVAALLDCNKLKNRYSNILPFDHSRVVLCRTSNDTVAADPNNHNHNYNNNNNYINANLIKLPHHNHLQHHLPVPSYIATQAPLPSTTPHFYLMCWEQSSCLIVTLANPVEGGRDKGFPYWDIPGLSMIGTTSASSAHSHSSASPRSSTNNSNSNSSARSSKSRRISQQQQRQVVVVALPSAEECVWENAAFGEFKCCSTVPWCYFH